MSADTELQELLQLFYQCPVGLIEVDDGGVVRKINPAAVRMLAPAIGSDSLTELFPLLRRIVPDLVELIERAPAQLGRLGAGRSMFVSTGQRHDDCVELTAVRVHFDRVMIVMVDVTAEHRLAEREHETALRLQESLLGWIDEVSSLEVSVAYRPVRLGHEAGGDWYDVIALPADRVGLIVGDVVGHDVAATAAMGQLRSAVRAVAPLRPDPAELIAQADRLAHQLQGARSSTMAYVEIDVATGSAGYVCAGHPPPLLIGADGQIELLTGGRTGPLGGPWPGLPVTAQARIAPGDTLVLYTDGLYERRRDPGEPLQRLTSVARSLGDRPAASLAGELVTAMLGGEVAADDICVLVARRPSEPARASGQVPVTHAGAGTAPAAR